MMSLLSPLIRRYVIIAAQVIAIIDMILLPLITDVDAITRVYAAY